MTQFWLDEIYMTSVHEKHVIYDLENPDNPTEDDLVKILKQSHIKYTYSKTSDHQKFSELRTMLHDSGYISANHLAWNADIVLKPFKLNEMEFVIGDTFLCAPALKNHLEVARRFKLI